MRASDSRPNVLLIMDDQHRFDYLGCAGAEFVRTPHIDRLAERGVRFSRCTTSSPVCAPARMALATGLQPGRTGLLTNNDYLPRRLPTYYRHLRDHEYRVGLVGKADLAKPDPYNGLAGDRPCSYVWGFTHPVECEGKMHAGTSATPIGPYTSYLNEKGLLESFHQDYRARAAKGWILDASHDSVLPAEDFEDAYIGRRAADWISTIGDDFPWHLFVSFVGPHDPFDPPAEYAKRCADADVPPAVACSMEGKPAWLRRGLRGADTDTVRHIRRQYCAAIELVDDQIGHILESVEARGMLDNTIVIFVSDHGEMLGDHGRFQKSVMYEPALRVPLIVAGPGIEGGRVSDVLVDSIDLNPTISELAGLPAQPDLDARSLAPVLKGDSENHREETISFLSNCRCVRTEHHKLILNDNEVTELYDLDRDPHELNNIAESNNEIVRDLQKRLAVRLREGKWRR